MRTLVIFLLSFLFSASVLSQDLKSISLNPHSKRGATVMEAFEKRASATAFTSDKLSLQDLSDLLWAADGINRPADKKRTAPSAMNAQDIDIYVFLPDGTYLYNASDSRLDPVAAGDQRALVAGRQTNFANAAAMLVLVSDLGKFKNGDPASSLSIASMDAGIISQNINIFCAAAGLSTRTRATMDNDKIKTLLKLKDTQRPLLNNPVSYPVKK